VFIHRDESPATKVAGYEYNTVLCQTNGILNVGEKTLIYHGRWRNAGENFKHESIRHYNAEVALATLPLDRWGSLSLMPGADDSAVLTNAVTLRGGERFSLNADGLHNITVSLLDESFRPVNGYESHAFAQNSGFDATVGWKNDLKKMSGQKVYIQIAMKRGADMPKLYAVYIDQ